MILEDLSKHGPSRMKEIIMRVEKIDQLPSRERTKKLYSYCRSTMVRLMIQGLVECSENKIYESTEMGKLHYLNRFSKRK